MTTDDLFKFYGCSTRRDLAKKLGYSEVTLWKWHVNGIPFRTQAMLQVETKGKLRAETSKQYPATA